jgi:sporulation protein YlmC with PRC-barrel domain
MSEAASITSGSLIAADKVKGTDVYNLAGDTLGTIDDIMIDKASGHSVYAVMSFGGFLGLGEKYHPLPWSVLKYNEDKGGYVVNLDKKLLEAAPSYDRHSPLPWTSEYGQKVDNYYKTPGYGA